MENETGKKDHVLAISIVIAALVIGGSFIYGSGARTGSGSLARTDTTIPRQPTTHNPTADDDVILGDPNAPITLIEFGDYQCPYCKKMFDETEKRIRDAYIATGKVKMVYRDFPLDSIHPYARVAAEAAECARDEGKYWAYHDELYARQSKIPELDFVALAEKVGLNESAFRACIEAKKYTAEVEKDYQDGIASGITGTPATFVLGRDGKVAKFIEGAQPYEIFKAAIDAALEK
jgi:protein-disulfide isomerase